MVAARDPAPVAMSSYEELKRRVAMLKQMDREETAARKAVAAQENAEVARAKAAMLAKEKENDERLHAAKKALHAATERSQAMRKQYESEVKKLQQKLDVTTGKLAASEEKASRDAVAAETRRRDALAEVNARWEADVAERVGHVIGVHDQDGHGVVGLEGDLAREHLVHHDPDRVEVTPGVHRLGATLLR